MGERQQRGPGLNPCGVVIVFGVLLLSATARGGWGQEQGRDTVEIGVVGQTTSDLITAPYMLTYDFSGSYYVGTPNQQVFGGPEIGYRYAFTRNFALEGRVDYLFGHQPTVDLSGGNELTMHAGVRASLPMGRLSLFTTVAPGLSSFNKPVRFVIQGSVPDQRTARITHFSVENSVGLTYRLAHRTALSFAARQTTLVEGDEYQGTLAPIPCVPPYDIPCLPNGGVIVVPGGVEQHLSVSVGLERSFGRAFEPEKPGERFGEEQDRPFRNEVLFLWANQPQNYLSTGYLVASNGFGGDVAHSLRSWLDFDAAVLTFPGGDDAIFQDGGSKTEVFAGVKAGLRRRYYGVFGKLRPGLVTSPDTLDTDFASTNPYVRNINFALDEGGAVEIYPRASHFVMRLDFGEVLTHYSAVKVATPVGNETQPVQDRAAGLYTLGVGWRF